jgi:sulfur relay (sulfurtransferase) complex TusBCD TusD component (DsrE family)
MARYLLIESRDPFADRDVAEDFALARSLHDHGDEVTVFLVQNGVLPARRCADTPELDALLAAGARVVADAFSLRERALPPRDLRAGVAAASLDVVLDAMVAGDRVLWL